MWFVHFQSGCASYVFVPISALPFHQHIIKQSRAQAPEASTLERAWSPTSRLKWNLPSQNNVDFRLELRFPPSRERPEEPELQSKHAFLLYVWQGDSRASRGGKEAKYKYFDYMHVGDEKWERMKESGDQYDGRIIEATWDKAEQNWKFLYFRDKEKKHADHASVVEKIQDGVEEDAVCPFLSSASMKL
ncbi:hypothetical protein BOTBODRAFT_143523 [Botryobasidium botryosum FD-172 SS1]|uniref:mRNA capping enzyme C-terminal domain-containing protein n=1 Tax=Botryobasidium botryosum (strain FD-172 SS1) TaxID=930990 RepID=A0A067N4B3_BOTB1|nr:hypothetical protein BOTBODRAFT_143523 [Botryobasidium botryosum FD-172 SS1]